MKRKLIVQDGPASEVGERRGREPSLYYQAAVYGILVVISILVPRTTVYGGLSPFGLSVAACVEGPACIMVSLGAAIGYLLAPDVVMPLRYIAALVCVIGMQWAFGGMQKITSHALFSPLLAAGSALLTGIAVNSMNGFQWDVLVAEVCESVLAGGFAYFFKNTVNTIKNYVGPRSFSLEQQVCITVTCAVLLMAVSGIVIGDISLGRILILTVILEAAKAGQQQGGMLAGVILGAATAFAAPSFAHLAAAYAFGGLLTGLFSRFGKIASAAVFVLVNILASFSMGEADLVIVAVYEVLAASLLFLIIPSSVERTVNAVFSRTQSLSAVDGVCRCVDMRLTYAAETMNEIAKTVDTVSQKLAAMHVPDMKEVYSGVCETLCNGCIRREVCWKTEFTDTMASFRTMGDVLQKNGVISSGDAHREFQSKCRHCEDVLSLMNHGYTRFVVKEHAYRRLADIRSIVTDQFEGMASLLEELAGDFQHPERVDLEAAARVEQVCERYRLPVVQSVCLIGRRNRMTIELLLEGKHVPADNGRWHKEVCDACGVPLAEPTVVASGAYTKIRLSEKTRYTVRFGNAQLNCGREKLCGDAFEQFYDHDGRCCVVLSDGMGTGGRAAVDGAMTAALAGRMLQAGFQFESVLRVINSALIVKSGDESLSTLDAVQIDLHSGRLVGLKAGAAPSFLYSRGHITQITASSLPIGILREVDASQYEEYITDGDLLVMMSDGVADDDTDWLEDLICRLAKDGMDEKAMASEIVFQARERQDHDHTDDTTALVLRVCS